ncbi:MAG: GNAT family N-acetyltransferase [Caldilineales bacterium]|nr:GNAT family N-acetyltransferase [Caldilineales bacterium]
MNELILHSERLTIRPFREDDLEAIHRILNEGFGEDDRLDATAALAERRSWLRWQIASYEWLAKIHQPPYGDRAVTLKESGELIGSVGFVPLFNAFSQIPELRCEPGVDGLYRAEFGLFWVIAAERQGQGFATEAGRVMIDYAFRQLNLHRILACTEYDNLASQGVMRKLGMMILHNPSPDPPWLQAVGLLENPVRVLE